MPSPKDPNKYLGPNVYTGSRVSRNRQPTLADYKQPETGNLYEIGCIWQVGPNPTTGVFGQLYMLQKIVANQGYWILLSTGVLPVGPVTTLSDTAGTLVMPTVGGNIQLFGGSGITVTSDPMNNKLTFALAGGGGTPVSEFTTDIAGPVVPNGSGVIDITGDYHSNTGTPLLTDGTTANTIVISSQITTTSLTSAIASNGIAHFDSTIFTADSDGFVSLVGGAVPPSQKFNVDAHTAPGTDPVVPTALGVVTITGGQVATGTVGTNVIRTNSTAANSMTVEVQRSTAVAATDVTKNGVCHFNSSQFSVDGNAFVSLTVSPGGGGWTFIEEQTVAGVSSITFNTSISSYSELIFISYNIQVTTVDAVLMNLSSDNGATLISGMRNPGGLSPTTNLLFAPAGNLSGSINIQNFSGTRRKVANGSYMSTSVGSSIQTVMDYTDASAQLNWIKVLPRTGLLHGTFTLFGR